MVFDLSAKYKERYLNVETFYDLELNKKKYWSLIKIQRETSSSNWRWSTTQKKKKSLMKNFIFCAVENSQSGLGL